MFTVPLIDTEVYEPPDFDPVSEMRVFDQQKELVESGAVLVARGQELLHDRREDFMCKCGIDCGRAVARALGEGWSVADSWLHAADRGVCEEQHRQEASEADSGRALETTDPCPPQTIECKGQPPKSATALLCFGVLVGMGVAFLVLRCGIQAGYGGGGVGPGASFRGGPPSPARAVRWLQGYAASMPGLFSSSHRSEKARNPHLSQ